MWAGNEHHHLPDRMTTKVIMYRSRSILMQTDPTEKEVKDCDIEVVSAIMKSQAPLRCHLGNHFVFEYLGMTEDAGQGIPSQKWAPTVCQVNSELISCPHTYLPRFLSGLRKKLLLSVLPTTSHQYVL